MAVSCKPDTNEPPPIQIMPMGPEALAMMDGHGQEFPLPATADTLRTLDGHIATYQLPRDAYARQPITVCTCNVPDTRDFRLIAIISIILGSIIGLALGWVLWR